ncbi:MAG: HxlR-like helix-turn-helix, partial [Hyphomicrobiales bacterium]|nr:HxlR-like helix-turn-helix [Hyphomicrobiales bacterium]
MLFGLDTSCAGDHIGLHRTALGTAVAQAMVNILKTDTTHFPVEYRPVSEILGLIGDKWTVLVVAHLARGKMRFSQLQ